MTVNKLFAKDGGEQSPNAIGNLSGAPTVLARIVVPPQTDQRPALMPSPSQPAGSKHSGGEPELLVAPFDESAAKAGQAAWASYLHSPVEATNSIGMKLRMIPAGAFEMGSPVSEANRSADEQQHHVRITKPFQLGATEVTQGEFQALMGRNPSYFSANSRGEDRVGQETDRFPVEQVTWLDAIEFCNKLSEKEKLASYYRLTNAERNGDHSLTRGSAPIQGGNGYRLPTEAEWEYACRAGTMTPFHFGSECNGEQANVDGNYPYGMSTKEQGLARTTTVGSYHPMRSASSTCMATCGSSAGIFTT